MDHEFARIGGYPKTAEVCGVFDSLVYARKKHPGQKNNLDILCRRYGIDNSHRELHGALLDAEILADVYLLMTGGQTSLGLANSSDSDSKEEGDVGEIRRLAAGRPMLKVIRANEDELKIHEERLDLIDKKSGQSVWRIKH